MAMQVKMIQHPVGQGGLFSGDLSCGGQPLRWLYDCGSNQAAPLQREIANVAGDGAIDLLFLSHLDSDHISGIDQLLLNTGVTEVVLPYLNEKDRTLVICRDIEAGNLTSTFLEFAVNPARWLIDRGVNTVTFIDGRDDDASLDDGPDGPVDGGIDGEGPTDYKWTRRPTKIRQLTGGATEQHMDTNAVVCCKSGYVPLNWVLSPYAHKPSVTRKKRFEGALRAAFGARCSIKQITIQARTVAGRTKLRDCYDTLWCNHNLVSMSLYAGPDLPVQPKQILKLDNKFYLWFGSQSEIGWLGTGDAQLKSKGRRDAFLSHYRRFLPRVDVFVVPHHGAHTYFHADLLTALPNLHVGIAAAGKNGYDHPHKTVSDSFIKPHHIFHKVNEVAASRYIVQATL